MGKLEFRTLSATCRNHLLLLPAVVGRLKSFPQFASYTTIVIADRQFESCCHERFTNDPSHIVGTSNELNFQRLLVSFIKFSIAFFSPELGIFWELVHMKDLSSLFYFSSSIENAFLVQCVEFYVAVSLACLLGVISPHLSPAFPQPDPSFSNQILFPCGDIQSSPFLRQREC